MKKVMDMKELRLWTDSNVSVYLLSKVVVESRISHVGNCRESPLQKVRTKIKHFGGKKVGRLDSVTIKIRVYKSLKEYSKSVEPLFKVNVLNGLIRFPFSVVLPSDSKKKGHLIK